MTYSNQMINESYSLLRECVRAALAAVNPSLERVEGEPPLLLVSTDSDFAGFVLLNGDPEANYQGSYAKFKEVYRAKHDQAASKALSFVLCRTDEDARNDPFYGDVETDVYFCRKYIIRYRESEPLLSKELSALPFLPLPEGGVAGIQRPPSAQSLLQGLGLSSTLARKIIVPREFSSRRMVANIRGGSVVLPALDPTPSDKTAPASDLPATTRVSSLEIEAFRAYKDRREFDLDADITVLYGPNGLGKTSFFDAIDYVCTGRIDRFCRHRIPPEAFTKIARHLDAATDMGEVCMRTRSNSQCRKILRTVNDRGHADVDGQEYDRPGLLQLLSSAHWQDKAPRIEVLESLFRATHLFSQTDPQLMSAFLTDSNIPFDLISRMLALDDYASGLHKVEETAQLVSSDLTASASELEKLTAQAVDLEKKLSGLQKTEVQGASASVDNLLAEVRAALKAASVDVGEEAPTVAVVRGWRSLVDGQISELSQRIQLAQSLGSRLPEIAAARNAVETTDKGIGEAEALLAQNTTALAGSQEALQVATAAHEVARNALAEAETAGKSYGQSVVASGRLAAIAVERAKQAARLQELSTTHASLQLKAEETGSAQSATSKQLDVVAAAAQTATQRVALLRSLEAEMPVWLNSKENVSQLESRRDGLRAAEKEIQASLDKVKSEMSPVEQQLADVTAQYDMANRDQDELTQLLDRVEAYVRDSVCPLCGKEHQTEQLLLEHIRAQKALRPRQIEKLAEAKTSLAKQLAALQERLRKLNAEAAKSGESLASALSGIEDALATVNGYEKRARGAGLEPDVPSFQNDLARAGQEALADLQQHQTKQGDVQTRVEELAASAKAQQQQLASLDAEKAKVNESAAALDIEEKSCQAVLVDAGLPPDITVEDAKKRVADNHEHTKNLGTKVLEASKAVEAIKNAMSQVQREHAMLEKRRSELQNSRAAQQGSVNQYKHQLSQLGFDLSTTRDHIAASVSKLEKQRRGLDALVSRLRLLETTLDATARSAAQSEAASALASTKEQIDKLQKEMATLKQGDEFFCKITGHLKQHASTAINEHIAAYGPLTTIIQKRLRAVYRFGDIRLTTHGENIHVQVDRGDNTLRPIDYFSDSQKQILMLSIFLAGRLTQTWSGFAPILMDDPVTHFDDLNAYAFVELLRGLLQGQPGQRQFIISTCEERLFRLMREKLADVAGGSRFYQLHCLTGSGPMVERLG